MAFQLRIVKHAYFRLYGHDFFCGTSGQLLVVILDNGRQVVGNQGGRVGFRAVGDDAHRRAFLPEKLFAELRFKDDHGFGLSFFHNPVDLSERGEFAAVTEKTRTDGLMDHLPADFIFRKIQKGNACIFDLGAHHKSEEEDLDYRNAEQDDQRPEIPENMDELLFYKSQETFHIILSLNVNHPARR